MKVDAAEDPRSTGTRGRQTELTPQTVIWPPYSPWYLPPSWTQSILHKSMFSLMLNSEHQLHMYLCVYIWIISYPTVENVLVFSSCCFKKMLKTTTIKMSGRHNSFRLKFLDHCNRWSKKLERRLEGRQEGEAVFSVSSVSLWNFNNGVWAPIFRVCLPLQLLLLSLSYTHAHMDTCS